MHNPKEVHLEAANKMLQYLNGSLGKSILFKQNSRLVLKVYTTQIMLDLWLIEDQPPVLHLSWWEFGEMEK